MINEQFEAAILRHYEECVDMDILNIIANHIASKVGEGGKFNAIMADVIGTCLFFSGNVGYADTALQFMVNIGGFYHGDVAKLAYEYVLSFNVLPFSVFPPTYEDFKSEASSFGIELS